MGLRTKARIIRAYRDRFYSAARALLREWQLEQQAGEAQGASGQEAAHAGSGQFNSGWDDPESDSPQEAYFESHRYAFRPIIHACSHRLCPIPALQISQGMHRGMAAQQSCICTQR